MSPDPLHPPFSAPYAPGDEILAAELLAGAGLSKAAEARIDASALRLIDFVRTNSSRIGGVEDLLRQYSLSSEEGVALMVLAESLLRVPDDFTADRLIKDKLASSDWSHRAVGSDSLVVSAAAWALGLGARVIGKGRTPEGVVLALARRIGVSALRAAARQAMQLMGSHFIFGETIEDALARARSREGQIYRYSYDMLGEGARTADDAKRYFESYANAIEAIGNSAGSGRLPQTPGISVKLSALHPRYEPLSRPRVLAELVPKAAELARMAKRHDLNFTIDAEEAHRLELSLDIIERLLANPTLAGWDGFGLAVQAYQKRAQAVIDYVAAQARRYGRRLMVRLVKGAYWDTEIKRAQEQGLADYPVFSRKAMTDLNYLACAKKLIELRDVIYPQFATHNALTIATIIELAGDNKCFEFQRLHGMGEDIFAALRAEFFPAPACRIYAPVGSHENLLAYLVRRLLENGANSSFVARLSDPHIKSSELLIRPEVIIGGTEHARAQELRLPSEIHMPSRKTANAIAWGDGKAVAALISAITKSLHERQAGPVVGGINRDGVARDVVSPIDGTKIGTVREASPSLVKEALCKARAGFYHWSHVPPGIRAACLCRAASLLETEAPAFLGLLQAEGGKTLEDAIGEWREAIDFCRYYAQEARRLFASASAMPGPAGEDNRLSCHGRGVFVCISPWNFPLSIFLGQTAAALAAGNSVLAKPAGQTPLIAAAAVELLHRSGVPGTALHLLPGGNTIGEMLVSLPVAGVAFTGSTGTATRINRSLAAKDGPIPVLIAETGGINTMIADATALAEQVCDDVLASAFRSAGQRCSALRLLCIQEDVADKLLTMICGAAHELLLGDPRDPQTDIGPIIDDAAAASLNAHIAAMRRSAIVRFAGSISPSAPQGGFYVAPHIFELAHATELKREIFGPILHVVRYQASELDRLLDLIESTGFGLTLGVHSRIDATIGHILGRRLAGNCYVNRSMIGAVVGTQPFGGFNLSGTGPKAGGPHYLSRFCLEQTISINTAAAGGDASLINNTR
jgi:RHH-type transcriptional regulator, proline utilization regulon repressor / proline dehydrogenase / delta 1-pyrroline-5-carboxylate dehydrogenase